MKRWCWLTIMLVLAVMLAGCGIKTSSNEDKQIQEQQSLVYGPEVQIAELLAAETADLTLGDEPKQVALSQELEIAFYDFGWLARWDYLPEFGYDGEASPEELGDYIYWIAAQAIAWENYWNIDHENSLSRLSTEYVDEFMQVHLGFTVSHWTEGQKEMDFDGQNYLPSGEWAYMPLYDLQGLWVSEENIAGQERVIYEARLREYSYWPEGDSLEDVIGEARLLLCGERELTELPEGFSDSGEQQLRFYLDEQQQIVYLGNQQIED